MEMYYFLTGTTAEIENYEEAHLTYGLTLSIFLHLDCWWFVLVVF
jgi:hypothetical protein